MILIKTKDLNIIVDKSFTELSEECLYSTDAGCGEFSWEELLQQLYDAYQERIQRIMWDYPYSNGPY